mmetsp:Transcript_14605/g.26390  ORF Transcript_14605/g.26390 Transcript_14605/m.26390 type:complete len:241 (-) Transcript_14605:213-935(-)
MSLFLSSDACCSNLSSRGAGPRSLRHCSNSRICTNKCSVSGDCALLTCCFSTSFSFRNIRTRCCSLLRSAICFFTVSSNFAHSPRAFAASEALIPTSHVNSPIFSWTLLPTESSVWVLFSNCCPIDWISWRFSWRSCSRHAIWCCSAAQSWDLSAEHSADVSDVSISMTRCCSAVCTSRSLATSALRATRSFSCAANDRLYRSRSALSSAIRWSRFLAWSSHAFTLFCVTCCSCCILRAS